MSSADLFENEGSRLEPCYNARSWPIEVRDFAVIYSQKLELLAWYPDSVVTRFQLPLRNTPPIIFSSLAARHLSLRIALHGAWRA